MFRTIASAAVAFTLAGTAYAGEFRDLNNRFSLTAPDGWTSEAPPAPAVALVVASPRKPETGGNCNVVLADNPLKGQTQAEIDQQLASVINAEFWKTMIGQAKMFKSINIDDWGTREQRGRNVHYVKATSEIDAGGTTLSVTQLMNLYVMPGQSAAITCTARTEAYDREEGDISSIMNSFEPRPDMTVAAYRFPRAPVNVGTIAPFVAIESAKAGGWRVTRR
ncbi:MAG: hypothetical protein KBA31_10790 [Alphaproteobacteria bacterium]|nr:hypothetical protein [Alphaproteobacteria bacterium]